MIEKLRAWDGNRMIYFNPFNQSRDFMLNNYQGKNKIMEFIGFGDTNLKDIYTGDIVEDSSAGYITYEVVFKHGLGFCSKCGRYCLTPDMWSVFRIVGNIYENPNLVNN